MALGQDGQKLWLGRTHPCPHSGCAGESGTSQTADPLELCHEHTGSLGGGVQPLGPGARTVRVNSGS